MKAGEQTDIQGNEASFQRQFSQLTTRTQIARMRKLAGVALADYGLPPVRVTLLALIFNTTFLVRAVDGRRYVLRIHRAHESTVESVGSELAWLAALRRDTALGVPEPVPTSSGSLLTVASAPVVPEPHICVLLRWLPGRRLRGGLTPHNMEQVGELMAHLQNHAMHWELSPGFTRSRVDWPIESARWLPDPFAPQVIASIHALVAESLSVEEADQVAEVLARVRDAERSLGINEQVLSGGRTPREGSRAPSTFGLIHADLHYNNLLFGDDTVRAIDFDDCGFGPLLYDPAVMLNEILDWPNYSALRAGLLAGYRRVRSLTADHEALIDTFIALRRVQDALWALDWRKHPAIREDWAAQARRMLAPLASFLAGEPL